MIERLLPHMGDREGHEFRYRLAAGFCTADDVVVDAACGTGYGSAFLPGSYVGVDRSLEHVERPCRTIEADLTSWQPDFPFDVFISFETIEHLADYSNLVTLAKGANRWVVLSAPVVPTRKGNRFHFHDFEPGDLERLMVDDDWRLYQTVAQPSELSEIAVFERVGS